MSPPTLVVMAGLPGVGKSALARAIGLRTGAVVLAVDAVEAAMWRAGVGGTDPHVPTGLAAYSVVQALAGDLLAAGHMVVADAVNGVEPARAAWREVAATHGSPIRWVEVTCSDPRLHRERLSARGTRYEGFREPTWDDARRREVDPWTDERLTVDSVRRLDELLESALTYLGAGTPSATDS